MTEEWETVRQEVTETEGRDPLPIPIEVNGKILVVVAAAYVDEDGMVVTITQAEAFMKCPVHLKKFFLEKFVLAIAEEKNKLS